MSKKGEGENEGVSNNQNTLFGIIIVLLLIIAVGGFFIGKQLGQQHVDPSVISTQTGASSEISDDIVITIYDDKRCTNCHTETIIEQLKKVPILAQAEITYKYFSEEGVGAFLKENNIEALPAAIFSTNKVGSELGQYLTPLNSGLYSLVLGATYDPFLPRSDNGFLIASADILKEIQETSYYAGSPDATITWIEYTDVNCHYCKKMETDGTGKAVLENFPTELNKTSTNYIGVGGAATQTAAELLECAGKIGGADIYNAMVSGALSTGKNDEDSLLAAATELGINADDVKSCFDNGESKDIVAKKFSTGAEVFHIGGTPGNILINNKTGEYELISGAYPAETFIATINTLLGKE